MSMLQFERALSCAAIGVDEAGRGPLAGSVYAAAVYAPIEKLEILALDKWAKVNDSKKLSPRTRENLSLVIKDNSLWAIGSATPAEIDEINILNATHLAMRRAVEGILSNLPESQTPHVLVDGLPVKGLPCQSTNIIKGDSKSLLIAAASILAKTARDEECVKLDSLFPDYGFAKHKGYPVKAHIAAIKKYGLCPEHRRSFGPCKQELELGI
ncbi:MAG: ribonuclease HII [Kiritimatiellae bacterium]|nr:ribonuclease HII [Kiritimatiellia bacterium]